VKNKFRDILISSSESDFNEKIIGMLRKVVEATIFPAGDERRNQLVSIMTGVVGSQNGSDADKAVAKYTKTFDHVDLEPEEFRVCPGELEKAHKEIDRRLLTSIRQAIDNVRKYQEKIFVGKSIPGKVKYTSIKRVGICVPGASAPLPSTVIMTAVPAQVAGVEEIVVVSPPRYKGTIHPVILAVCHELGIEEVYRIGGAQAIAALARGTQHIKKVYKIVGPGNQWVQMAKQWVVGSVDIDSVAGPSEVLIIADDSANPAWLAADMLSQAEHAPGMAILFTTSQKLAEKVLNELEKQVGALNRAEETAKCLEAYSRIVVFKDMNELILGANDIAPEHLEVQCGERSREIADVILDAGAIFIGEYSPVAVGDYWAGPSHTLPTGMTAKFFSALSANDFVKSTSIIEYSKEQLEASADDIVRLAMVEGLDAHAKSVQIRCKK
jgi:histidinol dehydrogenase